MWRWSKKYKKIAILLILANCIGFVSPPPSFITFLYPVSYYTYRRYVMHTSRNQSFYYFFRILSSAIVSFSHEMTQSYCISRRLCEASCVLFWDFYNVDSSSFSNNFNIFKFSFFYPVFYFVWPPSTSHRVSNSSDSHQCFNGCDLKLWVDSKIQILGTELSLGWSLRKNIMSYA